MGKGVDLAAQIWMAQDVPEQGAQRGCGTGTMLVKWQNDSAGTQQPLPATQASADRRRIEDGCLSRERINSFMFDFGDVRSDCACSYQFPWHHRRAGRS